VVFAIVGAVALVALNIAAYFVPIDYAAFASFSYVGAFIICLVANAVVAIPIPYIPIIAHVGASAASPAIVVIAGALGSVLGESVAFFVGRAEQGLVSEHAIYRRMQPFMQRKRTTALILFLLSAPLNPLFDVAGLAAGALGVHYRIFFASVFAGRLLRLALIVWIGMRLGLA
jgi:membrane protein YqaA with SNARE-associated domain